MTETESVVQDIRRELRWSYRDQSVANLLDLAKRLTDNKDTASIADAVKKYAAAVASAHVDNCLRDSLRSIDSIPRR